MIQVTITADNKAGLGWLAVDDPVPAGSTVLADYRSFVKPGAAAHVGGYRYIERTFTNVRSSLRGQQGQHSFTYETG